MPVKILSVIPKSPCAKKGIGAGDTLLSVNGKPVDDVLDYRFYSGEKNPVLVLENKKGIKKAVKIKKGEFEDTGLQFETYLMDKQRRCANGCIFCFIDQLPKGLRESLYFKDDDSRLSFLFGNYITLTNLTEREAERIVEMHISPVNISVHTMNPALRSEMMRNPKAGESLQYLKRFAAAGIKINTQLVLCPGINDGRELEYSLNELGALAPSVQSIAAVPVGLTTHRQGLFDLKAYTKEAAEQVINTVDSFNGRLFGDIKGRIAYAADEFYIKAGKDMPDATYYGDFPQLENGVGLWALLKDEFYQALNDLTLRNDISHEAFNAKPRLITVATGEAAFPLINELIDEAVKKWHNLKVNTVRIKNRFFGESITVAGLLTGKDISEQLEPLFLGEELLIPAASLRHEGDKFLDDVTLNDLSSKLRVKITPVPNNGMELLKALLGK